MPSKEQSPTIYHLKGLMANLGRFFSPFIPYPPTVWRDGSSLFHRSLFRKNDLSKKRTIWKTIKVNEEKNIFCYVDLHGHSGNFAIFFISEMSHFYSDESSLSIWMENARAWWVIFEQSLKVKKNGFLFGCESSPEVLDLPKLMNRKMGFPWLLIGQFFGPMRIFEKIFGKIQRENPKKSLPMFSRTNCRFRLTREKCARVVVYRRLGILRSYTLGKCSI